MDNRVKVWWRAHGPSRRRLIQVYAALLYNAHAKGFIKGEIYTALFKKFCKRDFCDEVRDFKIPEPEAVAS